MEMRSDDWERVAAQARRLEELADVVYAEGETRLVEVMETLSGAWDGAAAQSWLAKEEALRGELKATAEALRETASGLRETALAHYGQEREDVRNENG